MPYRKETEFYNEVYSHGRLVRWWYKYVGKLVYGGEPTCGHCKYWKKAKKVNTFTIYEYTPDKGDCRLLYGKEDTKPEETCNRFQPRRRYMHRVRTKND